jgi:hypothetical protein
MRNIAKIQNIGFIAAAIVCVTTLPAKRIVVVAALTVNSPVL